MPAQVTALVILDMVKDKIVQYLTFEFSLLDLVSDQTRGEQVLVDEFTRVCRLVRLQVS